MNVAFNVIGGMILAGGLYSILDFAGWCIGVGVMMLVASFLKSIDDLSSGTLEVSASVKEVEE